MESEAMRARRCEGGEAMLRGEVRRGEGEQCDASDARRAALGELRRGVAMRVRRCGARRGEARASNATVCTVVVVSARVYMYMARANALAKQTLWPEAIWQTFELG